MTESSAVVVSENPLVGLVVERGVSEGSPLPMPSLRTVAESDMVDSKRRNGATEERSVAAGPVASLPARRGCQADTQRGCPAHRLMLRMCAMLMAVTQRLTDLTLLMMLVT